MLLKETARCLTINVSGSNDRNRFSGVHEIDSIAMSDVSGTDLLCIHRAKIGHRLGRERILTASFLDAGLA